MQGLHRIHRTTESCSFCFRDHSDLPVTAGSSAHHPSKPNVVLSLEGRGYQCIPPPVKLLWDFLCENFIISEFTVSLSHSSVFKTSFIYVLLNQHCSYLLFLDLEFQTCKVALSKPLLRSRELLSPWKRRKTGMTPRRVLAKSTHLCPKSSLRSGAKG